ncbi:hypothetical protein [Phyllobacterium phragmitis]|uniref:Flagellar biosynthesis protein FliO n=1 Tax=Phyllobacterium phragmitis TaxID=2670329 RepID=A0ABQ0GY53_9HYPH
MNEWLAGIVGENAARIAGFILLFLLILVAIVIVFAIIRRLTGGTFVAGGRGRAPRLSVMDAAAVDNRRRLVLVRRDDVEHLILIGGPTDVVVEQNIVHAGRPQSRTHTPKTEIEPLAATPPAPSPAFSAPAREPQMTEAKQPEPPVPAPEPTPPVAPPVSAQNVKQPPAPASSATERTAERPQERPRPPVLPSRPVAPAQQAAPAQPAAPKPAPQFAPAPQFTQAPRPAPSYPPQPRTVLPQPPQPAARAHPAYPLSQVAKGVISATSGAAAASTAAASLNIAPGRDRPQAASPADTETRVQPSDAEKSADRPQTGFEESPAEPFTPAPPVREDVSAKLDTFGADLQDAIFEEFAVEEPEMAQGKESAPAENSIPDAELVNIFEDQLSGELDISPSENAPDKPGDIEDEMEKLLGELSKSKN